MKTAPIGLALALASALCRADQLVCTYDYGGESRAVVVAPVASPYEVPAIAVGSYFQFRVVFQDQPADSAAVKVYVYADRDDGPTPIHQAVYPYPPAEHRAHRPGFSGLHFVYEPLRDGELQYWCAMRSAG